MSKWAYYNEIDPNAAQWLRELIKAGQIAEGEVDERSITEVKPDDIQEFRQCHFFAGIGVWSAALRRARWPDDRPVWTGSCPCQPFSAAGKGAGFNDERHLWPAFHWLIKQCRPNVVLGEQVAGKAGETWLDLVSADLEGEGYAFGAAVTAACGFGAPHQRKRLYWVGQDKLANPLRTGGGERGKPERLDREVCGEGANIGMPAEERGAPSHMAHTQAAKRGIMRDAQEPQAHAQDRGPSGSGRLADSKSIGSDEGQPLNRGRAEGGDAGQGAERVSGSDPSCVADTEHDDGGTNEQRREAQGGTAHGGRCGTGQLADASGSGRGQDGVHQGGCDAQAGAGLPDGPVREGAGVHEQPSPGPTNGQWGIADWLFCRDGKWRAVEPGSFPLANGAPSELVRSCDLGTQDVESTKEARTMRLKGYGNAIVLAQAQAFIEAYTEVLETL